MFLTDEEKRMLDGEYGPGVQRSMDLLVRYGDAFDAERMAIATSAHIAPDCPEPLASELTEGADVGIMATTHARMRDPRAAIKLGVLKKEEGERLVKDYDESMSYVGRAGFIDASTCTPYLVGNLPKVGSIASWGGSSGAVILNSWFGVKLNRDGTTANIACAVTGRIPYIGLLLPENRYGKVFVELDNLDLDSFTEAHYGALGYYVGGVAQNRTVAINGLSPTIPLDMMKYFLSPLPVSGSVGLCFMVGISPEAPTVEAALGNKKPEERVVVGKKELEKIWERLNTATGEDVDLVAIGCPHFTIMEYKKLASLLEGKKVHKDVKFVIGSSQAMYTVAKGAGYVEVIEKAGGIFDYSCISLGNAFLHFSKGVRTMATDSSRAAHYAMRVHGAKVFYGTRQSCIDAAITGRWRV
jgi:predicted aconitase